MYVYIYVYMYAGIYVQHLLHSSRSFVLDHRYIHTYIHTHIHTHTYIHACIQTTPHAAALVYSNLQQLGKDYHIYTYIHLYEPIGHTQNLGLKTKLYNTTYSAYP